MEMEEAFFAFSSTFSTTGAQFIDSCEDTPEQIIFCGEFDDGDYYQVFSIALMMILIYLGMYLLTYAQFTGFTKSILDARMSELITREGCKKLKAKAEEEHDREINSDRFGSMPARLYLFFASLLSFIYFLIKLVLITNPYEADQGLVDDNRYTDVNDRYKDLGFKEFVNAETIILTYLLVHNLIGIKATNKLYFAQRKMIGSGCAKVFSFLCILVIWMDAIFTFVMLCIKWSLLIYNLYQVAVSIVVSLILLLFFCCTLPIFACFIVVIMNIFRIFSCGATESVYGRFMMKLGSGLAVAIISYFLLCLVLVFVFLFVGGPSDAILFINKDDPNHVAVISLFVLAIIVGTVSLLTGLCCACRDQLSQTDRQQLVDTEEQPV